MNRHINTIQDNPDPKRKENQPLGDLTENIQKYGLIHPVVLDDKGKIICGSRRYQALKELGQNDITVHIVYPQTKLDEIDIRLSENIHCKGSRKIQPIN